MHTYSTGKLTYDVEKLWQLTQKLPATLFPVDELIDSLYSECWDGLCPIDASEDEEHEQRVQEADLSFPILITQKCDIMDGMHRLVKASRNGLLNILAKVVPVDVASQAIVPNE